MASLTGQLVAETYKALLKTIDNDILTASEKQITDGFGGGSNVFIDSQGFLRANKYKVTNGLATQFLKADGSLDANTYLTGITSSQIITALGYTPVTNARTLTINGTTYDLSANRSWTIDGTSAVWGNISGTLSDQTDLQNALNAKYNNPTGTISQYIRGDGSLATFPAITGFVPYTGATANVDLGEFSLSAEYLAIDTDTTHSTDVGEIVWNPIDGTFDMGLLNSVVLQAGQELHFYGKASGAIGNGKAVMFAGVQGDHLLMSLADPATINANPQYFIGVATQDFANNDFGYVTILGKVRNLDTTAFTLGSVLYFDSASATDGLLTETQPIAPNAKIEVAAVVRVHGTQGTLMVRPHIMPKMSMIQDVYIADPANNHGLFYDLANGYWENKSIASALGYTPQAQLNGTGFVKASGTSITYDNSTYLTTTDAASTYQRLDKMVSNLLASDTEYPNSNAVLAKLALKADAANPVFTGNMTISGAEPKLYFTDTDNNPDYTLFVDSGYFYIYDQTAGATKFQITPSGNAINTGTLTSASFIKSGGTSSQFLMADGSVSTGPDLSGYLPLTGGTMTGAITSNVTANYYGFVTNNGSGITTPLGAFFVNTYPSTADRYYAQFVGNWQSAGTWGLGVRGANDNTIYLGRSNSGVIDTTATVYLNIGAYLALTSGNYSSYALPLTGGTLSGSITATSFIKTSGTSSQFLKADGSVDSSAYITSSALSAYLPLAGGTMSGILYGNSAGQFYIYNYARIGSPNIGRIIYNNGTGANMFFGEIAADVYGFTANLYSDTPTISMNVSSRRVGIGTATANAPLDVFSATTDSSSIQQWSYNGSPSSYRLQLNTIVSSGLVKYSFDMLNAGSTYNNNLVLDRGSIGIGTDAPSQKLHVNGYGLFSTASSGYVYVNGANSGGNEAGFFYQIGGSSKWEQYTAANDTAMNFYSYSAGVIVQKIFANGNIGIGTTTDAGYKFDVNGTGRFTGNLLVSNSTDCYPEFRTSPSDADVFLGFSNIGDGNNAWGVGRRNTGEFWITNFTGNFNSGTRSTILSIATSGAATFLSSVTATQFNVSTSGGTTRIYNTGSGHTVFDNSTTNKDINYQVSGSGGHYFTGILTASSGINFASTVRMRWGGNNTPALGFPFGGSDTGNSLFIEAADGDTGGIAINNDGITVYGAADTGFVFRAIDEDSYQSGVGLAAATTFQISQGTNGGGYLRGNLNIYNGSAYADAFYENSDIRLKKLIDGSAQVSGIENLEAKLYIKNDKTELGYFAQDAEKLMPYAVEKNSDGFLSLSYREVHTAKIARLEQRVAELEKQLNLN